MDVDYKDEKLRKVEIDPNEDCGRGEAVTNGFRKRMQSIRAALDERDFYAQKSLRFEKLKGSRDHERSMRINDQWRLILRLETDDEGRVIVLIEIVDYH